MEVAFRHTDNSSRHSASAWNHKVDWTEKSLSGGDVGTGRKGASKIKQARTERTEDPGVVHSSWICVNSSGQERGGHRDGESQTIGARGSHQAVLRGKVTWLKLCLQENSLVNIERLI